MDASTSTVDAVAACPHCGRPLKRKAVELFGVVREVPCYGSCGCAESSAWEPPRKAAPDPCIPARYASARFDLGRWPDAVMAGRSLYVHGPNGTAKSSFAGCLASALSEGGVGVYWVNSRHLITEMQGTYGGRWSDALDRARGCRVLFLDDIGKEQPTAYAISMLYELVEARYGALRPIVATSNFDRAALAARWAAADAETAEAIVSRLCDGCDVIEMGGEDRRLA